MGLPETIEEMASPKIKGRGKIMAAKHPKFPSYESVSKPSVRIMKCIGFQKFRYFGENRPGKKYQEKDFLQLALCGLSGRNVQVQIVCFDTENPNLIHPNGLVGKDCVNGVYSKTFPISKPTQIIRIPYLRTERILTKKTKQEDGQANNMQTVFTDRAEILPSPYKEQCIKQSSENRKYDTTRVCFGVIVTVEGSTMEPLFCLSNVVQNASEKTTLRILKLSTQYISAQEGGELDIFTSEDGPPITAGKCTVKVTVDSGDMLWISPESTPAQDHILYKRVVTYRVPAYEPNPATNGTLRGVVSLFCTQSGQTCEHDFYYEPGADSARRLSTIHSNKPLRKRPYMSDSTNNDVKYDDIKLRVKEKVKSRQSQEMGPMYDFPKSELPQNNQTVIVPNGFDSAVAVSKTEQNVIPLHQQDDILLAKDLVTGEVVYIRTPQNQSQSSDIVMVVEETLGSSGGLPSLLSDAPKAVAVPSSEWNNMSMLSSVATSTSVIRTLDSVSQVQKVTTNQDTKRGTPIPRRQSKTVSPWIVCEPENSPLINGNISFTQPKTDVTTVAYPSTSNSITLLKQEPTEMGPPILTPGSGMPINVDTSVGISNNLASGTLISNPNLPSLSSLLGTAVLEGMRFDDSGNLLSSSVFEMVQPYIEKMEK